MCVLYKNTNKYTYAHLCVANVVVAGTCALLTSSMCVCICKRIVNKIIWFDLKKWHDNSLNSKLRAEKVSRLHYHRLKKLKVIDFFLQQRQKPVRINFLYEKSTLGNPSDLVHIPYSFNWCVPFFTYSHSINERRKYPLVNLT